MADPESPTSFLRLPVADPASVAAEIAILGIPFGVPYPNPGTAAGCAAAPAAIRRASMRFARAMSHHDFDTGQSMLPRPERIVDCGDVTGEPSDGVGNAARAEATVRALLDQGVTPIVLGGDDSIPIPVLAAYEGRGPITVLQVDAHLDFRDEVQGISRGYSSPMRRASEMGHIERIVQVGLRGVGSARPSDVEDARAAGGLLITARELRQRGVAWVLDQLPEGVSVFISFDLDGLDPSLCPAVSAPAPGGLSWDEAGDLLSGAATRRRVVGAALTELVPERDPSGYSALVAARLGIRLLSAIP
jgi:agmatinase